MQRAAGYRCSTGDDGAADVIRAVR
eukprot:COSAG01_NODE_41090_length_455_cov_711.452247_1_plen_24_part_10